jgi:hypothetical protein
MIFLSTKVTKIRSILSSRPAMREGSIKDFELFTLPHPLPACREGCRGPVLQGRDGVGT